MTIAELLEETDWRELVRLTAHYVRKRIRTDAATTDELISDATERLLDALRSLRVEDCENLENALLRIPATCARWAVVDRFRSDARDVRWQQDYTELARQLGVTRNTVYRWRKRPETAPGFQRHLRDRAEKRFRLSRLERLQREPRNVWRAGKPTHQRSNLSTARIFPAIPQALPDWWRVLDSPEPIATDGIREGIREVTAQRTNATWTRHYPIVPATELKRTPETVATDQNTIPETVGNVADRNRRKPRRCLRWHILNRCA
jgi:hypothetical protein